MANKEIYVCSDNRNSVTIWQEIFPGIVHLPLEKNKTVKYVSKSMDDWHYELFEEIYKKQNSSKNSYIFAYRQFLCFGEHIIQLNQSEKNVYRLLKYIGKKWCKIVTILLLKSQYGIFSEVLETSVRFHTDSSKIIEKYMQTKEPFHGDVGYNILGEGQQFVDEIKGCTYNVAGLPVQAIKILLNRLPAFSEVDEGVII